MNKNIEEILEEKVKEPKPDATNKTNASTNAQKKSLISQLKNDVENIK